MPLFFFVTIFQEKSEKNHSISKKKKKNAGGPANPRISPYAGQDGKSSSHSLCGANQPGPYFAGQPDPYFASQVRGRAMQAG